MNTFQMLTMQQRLVYTKRFFPVSIFNLHIKRQVF